ncbi:MAG: hypothetical protein ABRQ39_09980, partial [Candidatus Eremiobacterota bacterium]
MHFESIFYPILEVSQGKEGLVDFVPLYGLYPHFLQPFFKIIGYTIFNFSFLMGFLLFLSFFILYIFLNEITRSRLIAVLGFFTLLWYNYFYGKYLLLRLLNLSDPYFQYHPVRFLFPCLYIYLTWKYFNKKNIYLYYSLFIICPVACLWNFDTGIVVSLSYMFILIYQELCEHNLILAGKKIAWHLISGFSFFIT